MGTRHVAYGNHKTWRYRQGVGQHREPEQNLVAVCQPFVWGVVMFPIALVLILTTPLVVGGETWSSPGESEGSAGTVGGTRLADSAPISVAQVAAAWKARQTRICTAKFEWTETKRIPRGRQLMESPIGGRAYGSESGRDERVGFRPYVRAEVVLEGTVSLSMDGRKVRFQHDFSSWQPELGRFVPLRNVEVCDGIVNKAVFLREIAHNGESDLSPERAEFSRSVDEKEMHNWFNKRTVLPVWYTCRPVDPGFVKLDLRNYRVGPKVEKIDGNACLVLESVDPGQESNVFFVDPARDFVVLRAVEMYNGGRSVNSSVDITYLRNPDHGWIPSRWVRSDFGGRSESEDVVVTTSVVKKYELNTELPPTDFQH